MICSALISTTPEGVSVQLSGELDLSVSSHLLTFLRDAVDHSVGAVEVELRCLRFIDCTGISALLEALRYADERGRPFYVSRPQGLPHLVMSLTDTLDALTAGGPPPPSPAQAAVDRGGAPTPTGTSERRVSAANKPGPGGRSSSPTSLPSSSG